MRIDTATASSIVPGASRELDWILSPFWASGGGFNNTFVSRNGMQLTNVTMFAKIGAGAEGVMRYGTNGPVFNSQGQGGRRVINSAFGLMHTQAGAASFAFGDANQCFSLRAVVWWSAAVSLNATSSAGFYFGSYNGVAGEVGEPRANFGGTAFGLSMVSDGSIAFVVKNYPAGVPIYSETALAWPNAVTVPVSAEIRIYNGSGQSDAVLEIYANRVRLLRAPFGTIGLPTTYPVVTVNHYSYVPSFSNYNTGLPNNPDFYWRDVQGIYGPLNASTF